MLSFRIITATICALLAVGILCALGTWQVKRLAWKDAIITELDRLYAQDVSKVSLDLSSLIKAIDPAWHYGSVQGHFAFDKDIALEPKILDGVSGYHILTPLITEEGYTILVNRGWSEDKAVKAGNTMPYKVSGIVRKPDWTAFTSQNSPEADRWFRADVAEISQVKDLKKVVPYVLYAENITPALEGTVLQEKKWYPKSNHKSYAIFWFSMALIAFVFYMAFMRSQIKNS